VDRAGSGAAFVTVAGGLAWKLARLRSMSPAEVVWRVEERLSLAWLEARADRAAPPLARPPAGFLAAFRASSAALRPPGERAAFAARLVASAPGEADRLACEAAAIRAGSIELFARRYALGPDPATWPWNRSPDGGPEVPLEFGPTLDYRDPARVGNARLAWELARAPWSAAPAMAAYLGRDEEANARFVVAALEAFDRACPPLRGLHWSSALELALRSLSWGWALSLVTVTKAAEEIAEERWERLFASWVQAMRFVDAHDSRYSSANNHRLGEAAGLAWAGYALSFLPESAGWRARGLERLEESFLAQTTEDGITREHAFAYQQFVLDFVVAVETVAVRAGRALPSAMAERIARVAQALDAFSPRRAEVWPVGDGDEGRALHLAEPWEERVIASLASADALVGHVDAAPLHARALWLGLEARANERPAAIVTPRVGADGDRLHSLLPESSGYAVERWTVGGREARLLFDAAPLGLPPLYAHGHADALQVLLDVDGPRLVDPGTGAYHSDPELRNRLRATSAHNTVDLDGDSQSRAGGLFQWFDPARIVSPGLRRVRPGEWCAEHAGYGLLVHRRTIRILDPRVILVGDRVGKSQGRDEELYGSARWHLGAGKPVPLPGEGGNVAVEWPDGFRLTLAGFSSSGSGLETMTGETWAPRFLEPQAASALRIVAGNDLPFWFVTVIVIGDGDVELTWEDGDEIVGRARTEDGSLALRWNPHEDVSRA
jgi:hypothetical protein